MNGKVLLLGGSGMIGRNILSKVEDSGWEFFSPSSKDLDLTYFEGLIILSKQ